MCFDFKKINKLYLLETGVETEAVGDGNNRL